MMRGVAVAGVLLVASSSLLGGCVVMKPVKPPAGLEPVAIGDGKGSMRTIVDPDLPPEVELRWEPGESLLVRPVINGTDAGWFVLDTGATGMLISGDAARHAGLEPIGTTRLHDGSRTTVFLGDNFQLGPLTLQGTKYAGMNFPHSRAVFGMEAGGICGFDLLAETIFELDASAKVIRIYDPDAYALPDDAQWQPLELHIRLPHAWCEFEGDNRGLFVLDSGYADAVCFFDDAVERYGLLADRKTKGRWVLNFGASTRIRQGPLAWFQLGETRIEDIKAAHFATQPMQLYSGPDETAGIIGMALMSRVRVVFDYSNNRMAFVGSRGLKATSHGHPPSGHGPKLNSSFSRSTIVTHPSPSKSAGEPSQDPKSNRSKSRSVTNTLPSPFRSHGHADSVSPRNTQTAPASVPLSSSPVAPTNAVSPVITTDCPNRSRYSTSGGSSCCSSHQPAPSKRKT